MKTTDQNQIERVQGTALINRRSRQMSFSPRHRRRRTGQVTARGRLTISESNEMLFEPMRTLRSEAVVKHRTPHGSLSRTKLDRLRITFEFDLYPRTTVSLQLEEEMQEMSDFVFNHFDDILI